MAAPPIYLDYNATTPVLPAVVDAMLPYLREHFGNPSSGHVFGRQAREGLEKARADVAALIGAAPEEIVFTSGGTEASNLAIRGVHTAQAGAIVTSLIEHPATEHPCSWLEQQGVDVRRLAVNGAGEVLLDEASKAITSKTRLVTVMHANNETGVLQPIAELAELAHAQGAYVHTDAAQSLGKVPVSVGDLNVDLLSIAGHKLYAPKGVGALYIRNETKVAPFMRGAGHESGRRPGTENVAFAVGLGFACRLAQESLSEMIQRQANLRDELFARLKAQVPNLQLNGHPERRLPNTLNVRFPGVTGDAVLAKAPGVAASTSSACHAGQTTASAVLRAMGIPEDEALGSVRLSLGRKTTAAEVEAAAAALAAAYRALVNHA